MSEHKIGMKAVDALEETSLSGKTNVFEYYAGGFRPSKRSRAAEIIEESTGVNELIESLKPFADLAKADFFAKHPEDSTCTWKLHARDIRRAVSLLKKYGAE